MSQNVNETGLQGQTKKLMDGPLKHIRAAALAAALVPLASILATPASAQSASCGSGGICGAVFNDLNHNGIQDAGETGLVGVKLTICDASNDCADVYTDSSGFYYYPAPLPSGTYTISTQILPGMHISPSNVGSDDAVDSDGVSDNLGNSVGTVVYTGVANNTTDFGFYQTAVQSPGTGTPGYWKNHPEAWPVTSITIGGVSYSRDGILGAIYWLGKVGKDKTTTMFSSLVSAKLNVLIGNDPSCISSTIAQAETWMATYGPVGSGVAASSPAWAIGEPLHIQMDSYNNGLLCAPHRN